MVQPQPVKNDSFKLQGPLEGASSDAVFEYYKGTSIFAAEQLLIKISKPNPDFFSYVKDYVEYSRSLYSIISPALLDFVEIGQAEDDRVFIVSENNNYQFLETFLLKKPQFLLEHICRYVIELGQALNAFHRQGLVYGCLDGKSVLVHTLDTRIDEIKVQKAGYGPFFKSLFTKQQPEFSTLVYIAPELFNRREGLVQSDIYSLGIHLFTLLTGTYPIPKDVSPSQGPSLKYVAKALVRRNVPQELILLILRCLRTDPLLRPANVIEVLTPLRLFMDERRKLAIQADGIDPMAVLDSLNMGKQRLNAQEVVRVLDTVDYFKSLAFAAPEVHQHKLLQYPLTQFIHPEEVSTAELQEAHGPPDDPQLTPEDYLDEAVKGVSQEGFSQLAVPSEMDIRKTYQPVLKTAPRSAEARAETVAFHQTAEIKTTQTEIDQPSEVKKITPEPSDVITLEDEQKEHDTVLWKTYKVTPQGIISSLQKARSRAKRSRGTISIIEEPTQGPLAIWLNRAIFQGREGCLYADMGSIPAHASIQQLIMALLYALTPALMGESKRSLQNFKRKLTSLGFSQLLQIDYVSPGYHGIFFKDLSDMNISAEQAIELIRVFCRRNTPLFVIMRNIEHLGKEGNAFLMALKDSIPRLPIILIGFFKSRNVEQWHILSQFKSPQ